MHLIRVANSRLLVVTKQALTILIPGTLPAALRAAHCLRTCTLCRPWSASNSMAECNAGDALRAEASIERNWISVHGSSLLSCARHYKQVMKALEACMHAPT